MPHGQNQKQFWKQKPGLPWIAAGAVVILLLGLGLFLRKPHEIYWQGRTLSFQVQSLQKGEFSDQSVWVRNGWSGPTGGSTHGELYGLKLGNKLLRLDVTYDPIAAIKRNLPKSLSGLVSELKSAKGLVLQCAVDELTKLGPNAKPALPVLWRRYERDDEPAGAAFKQLAQAVGPAGVPIILEALTNTNQKLTPEIMEILGEMGTNETAAAPDLSRFLASSNWTNILAAAYSLRKIHHADHGEVNALIRLLENPNPLARAGAAVVLGEFGADAGAAAQPLLNALDQATPEFAGWAARTLGLMGPAGGIAIPRLAEILAERNQTNMVFVLQALAEFGEAATPAIPALCAAADDEHFGFLAIRALASIGTNGLPCLLGLYRKEKPRYHELSAAIMKLGPRAVAAIPQLTKELGAESPRRAAVAAMALGAIGAQAKPAVPFLIESLRDGNHHLRLRAAEALWDIDRQTNAVLPVMLEEMVEWSRQPDAPQKIRGGLPWPVQTAGRRAGPGGNGPRRQRRRPLAPNDAAQLFRSPKQ